MTEKQANNIIKIAYYMLIIVIITFVLLIHFDNKSSLSEITIASCTVGLLLGSIFGLIHNLGIFLYRKNNDLKNNPQAKAKE